MTEQSVYVLALPLLALLLLVFRLFSIVKGRNFKLTLKGLGIELVVHTYDKQASQDVHQ